MEFFKKNILLGYGIIAVLDILFGLSGKEEWRIFTKPLLMPILMLAVGLQSKPATGRLLLLAALLFSLSGDILLMKENSAQWFVAGLASFLMAQICYTGLFFSLPQKKGSLLLERPYLIWVVVIYCLLLLYLLWPNLGDLRLAVVVYALVISTMLLAAVHIYGHTHPSVGIWFLVGAILFVVSDSLLAINKFKSPFLYAGAGIMLTYCLAQLFFVRGYILFQKHAVNHSS